jgi:hypothetical protein
LRGWVSAFRGLGCFGIVADGRIAQLNDSVDETRVAADRCACRLEFDVMRMRVIPDIDR